MGGMTGEWFMMFMVEPHNRLTYWSSKKCCLRGTIKQPPKWFAFFTSHRGPFYKRCGGWSVTKAVTGAPLVNLGVSIILKPFIWIWFKISK